MIKKFWLWITTPIKRRVLEWAFKEAGKKGLRCVRIMTVAGTDYIVDAKGANHKIQRKAER